MRKRRPAGMSRDGRRARAAPGGRFAGVSWIAGLALLGVAASQAATYLVGAGPRPGPRAGFDEGHYLALLRDGWSSITDGTTSLYYAMKSLPFLIVHLLFGFGDQSYWGMVAFNSVALLLASWAVARVLARQGLGPLVPAALLILWYNRAFLSFYVVYPRLPDVFSLALGALFLLGHLERRWPVIWLVLALSAVSSPQLTLFLLIYLAFPPRGERRVEAEEAAGRRRLGWALLLGIPALAAGLAGFFVVPERTVEVARSWSNPQYFEDPPMLLLSLGAAMLAIWWASRPLGSWSFRGVVSSFRLPTALAGLGVVAGLAGLVRAVSGAEAGGLEYTVRGAVIKMTYLLSKPGPGLLSHVVFYGVLGALALLAWRELSGWVARQGPGFALAFCFVLVFFGLDGEVRHVIFLVPSVVVGICDVARERLGRIRLSFLALTGFGLSLNWLVFTYLDPGYGGLRQLSAFGMCWTPLHYAAALLIVGAALWWLHAALRPPAAGRASGAWSVWALSSRPPGDQRRV